MNRDHSLTHLLRQQINEAWLSTPSRRHNQNACWLIDDQQVLVAMKNMNLTRHSADDRRPLVQTQVVLLDLTVEGRAADAQQLGCSPNVALGRPQSPAQQVLFFLFERADALFGQVAVLRSRLMLRMHRTA